MTTIPNEQVQELTHEQQDTVADVQLRLFKKRQKLLKQARGYRGYMVVPVALGLIFFCLFGYGSDWRVLSFCIFTCFAAIQFHASGINRRMDALLELLDTDIKRGFSGKRY